MLAYQKEYRKAHPEFYADQLRKGRIRSRKYWLENSEKVKEQKRKWYMKNRKKLGYKRMYVPSGTGWSTVRLKVLARDNYICQKCGKSAKEVHHLDGTGSNRKRKEMNNGLNNLITVCHKCHVRLDLIQKGTNGFGKGKWQEEEERNAEIIKLSKKLSQTKISKMFGITRQRVNQIIKKDAGIL